MRAGVHLYSDAMLVFTAIPFSPWSEKARWALDHHHVEYREASYTPVLGEYALRWRMRRPFGRISVPVLQDGPSWLTDSFDIARHAEEIGCGTPLFPNDATAEIEEWNRKSEATLASGRAILMRGWARTPELADAALPPWIPKVLAPLLRSLGKRRLETFMAKYGISAKDRSHDHVLAAGLDELRKALSGRRYLVGDSFSYADITMALTLQQVSPVDPRFIVRLSGLDASGMHIPELAERYADLLAWRDDLYARHRRAAVPA